MSETPTPVRVDDTLWEIPADARSDMRVPARVFADEDLLAAILTDRSLEQLQNVATLPGIVEAAIAMPDIHQGYGFPVGGLAATAPPDGVVSPGGVGYDINCGVRLLAAPFAHGEIDDRTRGALVEAIARRVPTGAGKGGPLALNARDLDAVLVQGPRWLVEHRDVGTAEDVAATESEGRLEGADPGQVSPRARERGAGQLGTVGSGNHFIEVQRVEELLDREIGERFGLRQGQVTILIHSGSRGLGHQVCTDYVRRMDAALPRHGITLPDRQLSCAPIDSDEGRAYLGAMAAAANFAWSNRHAIAHGVRRAIADVIGADAAAGTRQVYDVAHNVAKLEEHRGREVCVHRKGATRAFPGQPVFIPGSMGTASYVLAGREGSMERTFGTVCHGAGRRLSRTAAKKQVEGGALRRELELQGIAVRAASSRGLAEEAPLAYKDVDAVVRVVEQAGLAGRVARLRPIGVVKG
jgi:tRNA-splicing ligase RtcB (3'-phosphate/5'-hydroxy nucleic acid ligase)